MVIQKYGHFHSNKGCKTDIIGGCFGQDKTLILYSAWELTKNIMNNTMDLPCKSLAYPDQ